MTTKVPPKDLERINERVAEVLAAELDKRRQEEEKRISQEKDTRVRVLEQAKLAMPEPFAQWVKMDGRYTVLAVPGYPELAFFFTPRGGPHNFKNLKGGGPVGSYGDDVYLALGLAKEYAKRHEQEQLRADASLGLTNEPEPESTEARLLDILRDFIHETMDDRINRLEDSLKG